MEGKPRGQDRAEGEAGLWFSPTKGLVHLGEALVCGS